MEFKTPKLEDKNVWCIFWQNQLPEVLIFRPRHCPVEDHYHMTYMPQRICWSSGQKTEKGARSAIRSEADERKPWRPSWNTAGKKKSHCHAWYLKETEEKMKRDVRGYFTVEYDRDLLIIFTNGNLWQRWRGKKLHGKRNHINRFKENHDWSYESLNDENALEALTMLMEWKMASRLPSRRRRQAWRDLCCQECSDVL